MIIIGVDFHPEFQQIALLNTTTGEVEEKRLADPDEAEKFYHALAGANETVRIGMEASGHARWFERLMAELQFELWIGDAAVKSGADAASDPHQCNPCCLAQDHREYFAGQGAESHPNTDLAPPLCNGICHHAVDAHGGKH